MIQNNAKINDTLSKEIRKANDQRDVVLPAGEGSRAVRSG